MTKRSDDIHEEFGPEISALRESCPELTPLELDRVSARARARARHSPPTAWRRIVSTRAAVVAAIATGALMSSGGVAIGVSGFASSGGASVAQYSSPGVQGTGNSGAIGSARSSHAGATAPNQAVSAAEQVEQPAVSSSGKLPFTGFAALPLLIIGLALIIGGLITRRAAGRAAVRPPH